MTLPDNVSIKIIIYVTVLTLIYIFMLSKLLDADAKNLLTNIIKSNFTSHQHDNIMNDTELTLLLKENQNLRQQLNHVSASGGIVNSTKITVDAFDDVNKSKNIIYGHVHMAKTGGTSLNGMLANKFERVCGHRGYSYDAYNSNENAKKALDERDETARVKAAKGSTYNRDRVHPDTMQEIGYEDCDYISNEVEASFWNNKFAHVKFHGIHMELHIPCREPIDHLLSQCNERNRALDCSLSSNEYLKSVRSCFVFLNRYNSNLQNNFDSIKCYDFNEQFTTYINYMGERLQERRIISEPYIKRETNKPRNKTNECLLQRPDLINSTREFLLKFDYYKFCDSCIGSDNDITNKMKI